MRVWEHLPRPKLLGRCWLFLGGLVFPICIIIPCIIYAIILRQRRLRRLLAAGITTNVITTVTTTEDGTAVITEEMTASFGNSAPVTQNNPLYQPGGPLSDQPPEQPPPYTETPTGGPGRRYALQSDSFAAAPRKTAGVVQWNRTMWISFVTHSQERKCKGKETFHHSL